MFNVTGNFSIQSVIADVGGYDGRPMGYVVTYFANFHRGDDFAFNGIQAFYVDYPRYINVADIVGFIALDAQAKGMNPF